MKAMLVAFSLCVLAGLAGSASAALLSGVYQTQAGTTVTEWGDRVPNERRIVPCFATLTFDLEAMPPSLVVQTTNAVLEGGAPFALTVRSASGVRRADGSYRFQGDYLRELYPSGTQYGFDWQFSTPTNDEVVWHGTTAWYGGHLWFVTISNLTLVARPNLEIARAAPGFTVSWPASDAGFQLEQATSLPSNTWVPVTNSVVVADGRQSVTIEPRPGPVFFRLRKS